MIKVAVGVILQDNPPPDSIRVLLCQRRQSARYGLKWEFPGGKLEKDEPLEECLRRELREELGIDAHIGRLFHQAHFAYPDGGSFHLFYYLINKFSGTVTNHAFEQWLWVPAGDLPTYDMLEGNQDITQKLVDHYGAR